jgi:serine/threonine protein kinase
MTILHESTGNESTHCPECGELIPADAPEGICPQCVLLQGIANESENTVTGDARQDINVADIASAFPNLEIQERIGGGGMGTVFKAHQPGLNRTVALKILSTGSPSPEFRERFLREARAMAKLSHPDIVTIHEFGESEGYYYFIMEFVEGESLAARLRNGPLDADEATRIIDTVAQALEFAHDKGIVHRDIKPGNILLGADDSVKVADFGLAKIARDDSAEAFSLTMENQTIGTPFYMAPEQRIGASKVDHRADIYALGVVLYEMLTGKPPELDYNPPSDTAGVSQGFNELVRSATASDPEKRIPSATAFRTRLAVVSDQPTGEKPKRRWNPIHVFRKRWWAFLPGGLVGAPALGLVVATLITYAMPREYLGRVRLQIEQGSTNYEVFGENTTGRTRTPTFIQTQFQIIRSKENLRRVIDELGLVEHWSVASPETAYDMLLEKLETEEVRGTDLIDIEVYSTDPREAAELANAIAESYRDRRNQAEASRSKAVLDTLNTQEHQQSQQVEEARIKIPAASCGVFRRGEVVRSPQAAGNQTLRD